jgi:hypothetical protein
VRAGPGAAGAPRAVEAGAAPASSCSLTVGGWVAAAAVPSNAPTRRRERVLQRFTSPTPAPQFLAPFGPISDHFRPRRHRLPAPEYRQLLLTRFAIRRGGTGLPAAA